MSAYEIRYVEGNYNLLTDQNSRTMKAYIPDKLLKTNQSVPLFNNSIKRMYKKQA